MKLPKTTKAAVLVENNKPLEIWDIKLPENLTFGQVLVKIHYSGICGAQINEIMAAKGKDKFLPHLLGHEASGTVLDVGEGVKYVSVGDSVVLHWRPGLGLVGETPKYIYKNKKVNAGWVTTFQEYSVVSENRVTKIPESFDKRLSPLFGCAITTAMGVVNNDAHIKIGQSVVVIGAGGVGLNIIQAARLVSAYPIIAVDIIENKLVLAKKFGATTTFNSSSKNWEDNIKKLLPNGPDVVIDTTGLARIIEIAYELTAKDGKCILVGVPKFGDNINIYTLPLHFDKVLKGSHGGGSMPGVEISRYIKLHEAGILKLEGLVTNEFKLDEVNEAINLLKKGESGRIILKM